MKALELHEMEKIEGGAVPKWLACTGATLGTVVLISSIFTGNVTAIILGPSAVGIAWGACATI